MEILGTTLRVCVDDLDSAVVFYERPMLKFERPGEGSVEVARTPPAARLKILSVP